jgi:penicillin-binding protein 1A
MGRSERQGRIEPTFRGAGGLALSEEDRVLPSSAKRRRKTAPTGRQQKRGRRGFSLWRLMGRCLYWSAVAAIWAAIGTGALIAYYGAQMPSATTWAVPDRPPNVKVLDRHGTLLANRGLTGGEAIGLHEMSPLIPQAVIAIEDRRFYSHRGIDPLGLARAMLANLREGRLVQGGSTLTQQLAKNLFLKPERTLERKVQEVLLALWLEQTHSKNQILEMYLNRVYFGSGAYGAEAASRRYFGKSARDVNLAEAALLAGLLKAPSRLSPARDPQAAEERAQLVLAAMREEGMIGDRDMALAMSAPATRAPAYWTGAEHYVADRVMEELPGLVGNVAGDIVVETTVDLRLQKVAEKAIRRLIEERGTASRVSQGALVAIAPDGAVRAMVGGADYAASQFDRASEARRQPGSAFKPFVFLAALEQGSQPDTIRNDAPVRIGKWTPANYKDEYHGPVTLSQALAKSLNSVAAQLAQEVGPKTVIAAAHRLGIESRLAPNVSIALGTSEVTPLELTAAYVPFANGGFRPEIRFVDRVTTPGGRVLYEHQIARGPRVVDARIVGMMNAMMSDTIAYGTGRRAAFGWPAAGKTGTTQNSRDAWFVGYTAELVTGVWFGNDDGRPMKDITGGSLPVLAWQEFMAVAHEGRAVAALPGEWSGENPREWRPAATGQPPRPPAAIGVAGGFNPRPSDGHADPVSTSATRRPVPPAAIGEQRREGRSILDIILGGG